MQSAPDLAKELGTDGLRLLLKIMCDAYYALKKNRFVLDTTPEDVITEEWFLKIQDRSQGLSVKPIPQKQDPTKGKKRGKAPTIDFCFRHERFSESYLGAECKLLDEGSSKHLREYMSDKRGIGRFLDGRYAYHSSVGAMVGYVRVGNPKNVAKSVRKSMSKFPDKPRMIKDKPIVSFEDIYKSRHTRTSGKSPFKIFHLFYAFRAH
jgi:hypothetical protein